MPNTQRTLIHTVRVARVPWSSGGDANVFTRPRRGTIVNIRVNNLRVSADGREVLIHVFFSIAEQHPNRTTLVFDDNDVPIPVPYDWGKAMSFVDVKDFDYAGTILGHHYEEIPVEPNDIESCAQDVRMCLDGPGRDDSGNAWLQFNFKAKVLVEDTH